MLVVVAFLVQRRERDGFHAAGLDGGPIDELADLLAEFRAAEVVQARDGNHRAGFERADHQARGLARGALDLDEVDPAVARRFEQAVVMAAVEQVDAFHRLIGRLLPEGLPRGDGYGDGQQAAGAKCRRQDEKGLCHASVSVRGP